MGRKKMSTLNKKHSQEPFTNWRVFRVGNLEHIEQETQKHSHPEEYGKQEDTEHIEQLK